MTKDTTYSGLRMNMINKRSFKMALNTFDSRPVVLKQWKPDFRMDMGKESIRQMSL